MTSDDSSPLESSPRRVDVERQDRDYADAMASVRHAIGQFRGCSEAEKAALTKELADLEELEVLNLNDTAITDAGLKELKTKVLGKLSLRGCKKVTKAGIAAIKAQNPKVIIEGP